MKMNLPENVNRIIHILEENGHDAYAVGGCVRDTLLGREPQDWDITTAATPGQVKALFSHTIDTGIQHGTVTVMMDHVGYEVTTFRIDGEYEDSRHPKEVTFTSNLVEDLKRRDFTINAMAYNERTGLVDAFDGMGDLKRKVIRCVGSPRERFTEDALRMLRAVRFAAQLGFDVDEATAAAIGDLAPTIAKVSAERIQVEMVKLLTSAYPQRIRTAYELGLTKVFLPEFDAMMETNQVNKHHMYSVGEHTIHALECCRPDKVLRLTMLLHDVAKPVCISIDENGQNHFHRHPQVGAEMARSILRRLKFDNDTTDRVCKFVLEHDDRPQISEHAVRRAMSRIGSDNMPMLFEVKRADALAQSMYRRQEKLSYIDLYEETYRRIVEEKQCVVKSDMAINGRDLIAMGMEPGKEIGRVLDELFEMVLCDPSMNRHDKLMEQAHKLATPFI